MRGNWSLDMQKTDKELDVQTQDNTGSLNMLTQVDTVFFADEQTPFSQSIADKCMSKKIEANWGTVFFYKQFLL